MLFSNVALSLPLLSFSFALIVKKVKHDILFNDSQVLYILVFLHQINFKSIAFDSQVVLFIRKQKQRILPRHRNLRLSILFRVRRMRIIICVLFLFMQRRSPFKASKINFSLFRWVTSSFSTILSLFFSFFFFASK